MSNEFPLIEVINLVSSLASLVLSIVAIWLAMHFYDKSKDSEKNTEVNVSEIKAQTQTLTEISSRMLDKYTDYATKPKAADESFMAVIQLLGRYTGTEITAAPPQNASAATQRRYSTGITIAATFYAGLANLAIQDLLPQNAGDIPGDSNLPQMLDTSSDDFHAMHEVLVGMDMSEVQDENLENLNRVLQEWAANSAVKSISNLYTAPA